MTTFVFAPPVLTARIAGEWSDLPGRSVSGQLVEDADVPPRGEPAGYGGRLVFLHGYKYDVGPETAKALADSGRRIVARETVDERTVRRQEVEPTLRDAHRLIADLTVRVEALEARRGR